MYETGLIYGYELDGQGGGRKIDGAELEKGLVTSGLTWLHFDYTDEEARAWITERSELDDVVVEALLTGESRPRSSQIGDGLLIALRGVNLSPGSDPEDMVAIRIWIERDRIISTRRRRMLSVRDVVESLDAGTGPATSGEFLAMLSGALMSRMQSTIESTDDTVANIEDEILGGVSYDQRNQIAAVRRMVIYLRRYLAPQREAMVQMHSSRVSWLSDDDRQILREVNDHLMRYIEDLDSARDRAAVAQEELANRLSEQMNNRMYVLSLVAAVFLPLGFLTGLLGINVGGLPGVDNPWAFWIVTISLAVSVALQVWVFKRRHWF